jgi:hypothetical protein
MSAWRRFHAERLASLHRDRSPPDNAARRIQLELVVEVEDVYPQLVLVGSGRERLQRNGPRLVQVGHRALNIPDSEVNLLPRDSVVAGVPLP